jgi:hypothetical protein
MSKRILSLGCICYSLSKWYVICAKTIHAQTSNDDDKPYVLTAIRKDIEWNHYGGSWNADKVGIEIK